MKRQSSQQFLGDYFSPITNLRIKLKEEKNRQILVSKLHFSWSFVILLWRQHGKKI